jgi:DedD protein
VPAANPNELSYAQALEGRGADPATVTPPAPPPEEPAPAGKVPGGATPSANAPPPAPAPAKSTDVPAPKATPPAPKPEPKPVPPPAGGYIVQVEAFGSNDVAAREVAKLQRRGHPAKVFTAPDGTPGRFKVQVGPFASRAEADKAIKALRTEGYKPLIKR